MKVTNRVLGRHSIKFNKCLLIDFSFCEDDLLTEMFCITKSPVAGWHRKRVLYYSVYVRNKFVGDL